MPKTQTDDVNALPSTVLGPVQIIDPADDTSHITIDPANAQIAAAGGARPVRILVATYARAYGSSSGSYMSSSLSSRTASASSLGGLYYGPFQIPLDFDVTETSTVKILISAAANATTNGQVVRLIVEHCHITDGVGASTSSRTIDWSVPDDWTVNDYNLVTADSGSGYTFDANTFQVGDHVGVKAYRSGIASEDTFDKSLKIAQHMILEYTAKDL